MDKIVRIADMKVSNDTNDVLRTLALGSCIGVAVYDPSVKVGGLLHYMLPDSKRYSEKAKTRPYMFGDTGIELLLDEVIKQGAIKSNLKVVIAGGAQMVTKKNGVFNIGRKNTLAANKILTEKNLGINVKCTGSSIPRSVSLEIRDGVILVTNRDYKVKI